MRIAQRLDLPGIGEVVRQFHQACFVSISDSQRAPLKDANRCGTMHHGLLAGLFRPSYAPGSYLAFLGRLTPDKGPEDAIRIARAAGMPLRIAAKVPRAETGYFKKHIQPEIEGLPSRSVGHRPRVRWNGRRLLGESLDVADRCRCRDGTSRCCGWVYRLLRRASNPGIERCLVSHVR